MSKPKIQPLIPPVRRRSEILLPLLGGHRVPFPVPVPVAQDIVELGEDVDEDVDDAERDETRLPRR